MEHLAVKKEKKLILAEMFTNKENKILRKTEISTNDSSNKNVPPLLALLVVIVVVAVSVNSS
jgi:hypothetical protein